MLWRWDTFIPVDSDGSWGWRRSQLNVKGRIKVSTVPYICSMHCAVKSELFPTGAETRSKPWANPRDLKHFPAQKDKARLADVSWSRATDKNANSSQQFSWAKLNEGEVTAGKGSPGTAHSNNPIPFPLAEHTYHGTSYKNPFYWCFLLYLKHFLLSEREHRK